MYLKEIIINGFKSFATKTRVILGPGVTTIVGPNGCGKSNIVDAIRWVLGEQSAKSLRGGSMLDVIFAGTDKREPLPECEVTLLFSDCEKELGTAFNEVQVTRRVSREGSGQYFLNAKPCRLKDIQQLFMDTGIGRVSYSFMVQGQIDQILSSNPGERRLIFEEAAGITRYKSQRREALNKLLQVDQNLSRIADIIDEVNRQLASFKRQANKAIRYQEIKHRLSHFDLAYQGYQFSEKNILIQKWDNEASRLRKKIATAQASLDEKESSLESLKSERSLLYATLQKIQQTTYDFRSQKNQFENQVELATMRSKDALSRIDDIQNEKINFQKQLESIKSKTKDDFEIKQLQLSLADNSGIEYKKKQKELDQLQHVFADLEKAIQVKKTEFLTLQSEIRHLQIQSTSFEVKLKTDEAKVQDLNANLRETKANQKKLLQGSEATALALEKENKVKNEAQNYLERAQEKHDASRDVSRNTQKAIQEHDRFITEINAKITILKSLQSKFEGFSKGARSILTGKLDDLLSKDCFSLLSNHLDVPEEYAFALETLLGQAMDAIALDTVDDLLPVTVRLAESNLGRACLHAELSHSPLPFSNKQTLPSNIIPVSNVVRSHTQKIKARWEQILKGCYFCDSLDVFIHFWKRHPDFQFLLVATCDGALIDARGLVFGGGSSQKGKESSFIKRDAEIKNLAIKLKTQKKKHQLWAKKGEEASEAFSRAEDDLGQKRQDLAAVTQNVSVLTVEAREAKNAFDHNEVTLRQLDKNLKKINATYAESETQLTATSQRLKAFETQLETLRKIIEEREQDIVQKRENRDAHREMLSEIRVELAEKRQRLGILEHSLSDREQQQNTVFQKLQEFEKEVELLTHQKAQYVREIQDANLKIQEAQKALDANRSSLEKKNAQVLLFEQSTKSQEDELSQCRQDLHEEEESLKKYDLRLASEQSQLKFLIEKVETEYQVAVQDVDWKRELWAADEPFASRVKIDAIDTLEDYEPPLKEERPDPSEEELNALEPNNWDVIQQEIIELRNRIASMGPVNLAAIEEYSALKERHTFLTSQYDDLVKSKDQLLEAIENINEISQNLFKETFDKVRQNFRYTFDALFGGGEADLRLIEAEDALESGIEIIARPPGTKLKNLSLLSGGQKTMTAVALLFAIYKVKPSPFCVLDELDAPLDDANIGRFTLMLREFTRYSQFLVISHNKRTIAASDILYGVTMQEKGVTSLISMRFKDKKNNPTEESINLEEAEVLEKVLL